MVQLRVITEITPKSCENAALIYGTVTAQQQVEIQYIFQSFMYFSVYYINNCPVAPQKQIDTFEIIDFINGGNVSKMFYFT